MSATTLRRPATADLPCSMLVFDYLIVGDGWACQKVETYDDGTVTLNDDPITRTEAAFYLRVWRQAARDPGAPEGTCLSRYSASELAEMRIEA